jgi:hypothetical protein
MPKTLNPNNNFPTSIANFPLAGNNEPLALGPLEAAIQAVLDRTENLHQSRLTLEGIGTKRIRQFASRSALSAASGFADGDIVSVDGYGLYRLFVSSSATVDGLWVLTASGGGRWIHLENDLKGANGGLATLDSGGRLSQDPRDGSIATVHLVNSSVTGVKLAPGAALANLGYTPLNKAGDTITGDLTVSGMATLAGRTFRKVSFVPTSGVGWYRIIANANIFGGRLDIAAVWNARASYIALEGYSGGFGHIGYFNATQVYQHNGTLITQIRWGQSGGQNAYLDIYVSDTTNNDGQPVNLYFWGNAWTGIQTSPPFGAATGTTNTVIDVSQNGVLQARYDHQNRFVFSSNVGFDYSLPGGSYTFVAQFMVRIPNGKSLYLRRARYRMTNPAIRLRVSGQNTFTSSNTADDVTPDALIDPNSGLRLITVTVYNSGSNNQTFYSYDSYWLEFEIA